MKAPPGPSDTRQMYENDFQSDLYEKLVISFEISGDFIMHRSIGSPEVAYRKRKVDANVDTRRIIPNITRFSLIPSPAMNCHAAVCGDSAKLCYIGSRFGPCGHGRRVAYSVEQEWRNGEARIAAAGMPSSARAKPRPIRLPQWPDLPRTRPAGAAPGRFNQRSRSEGSSLRSRRCYPSRGW